MANGKMIPARSALGSVPPEALKQGSLNESVGAAERTGATPEKLDAGPKRGEKGEYLPAAYKLPRGAIRVDN